MESTIFEYEDWTEAIDDFITDRCVIGPKNFSQYSRLYVEFIVWMNGKILLTKMPSDVTFNRVLKQEFETIDAYKGIKEDVCYHYGRRINGYKGVAIVDDRPFDTSSPLYGLRLSAMQDERGRQAAAIRMRGIRVPVFKKRDRTVKPHLDQKEPLVPELPTPKGYDPNNDPRGALPPQRPWETGQYSGLGTEGFLKPKVSDDLVDYLERSKYSGINKDPTVEYVEEDE